MRNWIAGVFEHARFVDLYKIVYLFLILGNLILMPRFTSVDYGATSYLTNLAIFLINALSWFGWRSGKPVWVVTERMLSVGRMLSCAAMGTVILGPFPLMFSPVTLTLWLPVLWLSVKLGRVLGFVTLIALCGVLLCLEALYCRKVGADGRAGVS